MKKKYKKIKNQKPEIRNQKEKKKLMVLYIYIFFFSKINESYVD